MIGLSVEVSHDDNDELRLNQMMLVTDIMDAIARQVPGLPAEPRLMNCIIAAADAICAEFDKPVVKASAGMGLAAWLASDDVGMSSKFMASVLSGQFMAEFAIPHDTADFGRCVRMIEAVPELEGLIHKMCDHGVMWAAVADNWERWQQMVDEGHERVVNDEMRDYRNY